MPDIANKMGNICNKQPCIPNKMGNNGFNLPLLTNKLPSIINKLPSIISKLPSTSIKLPDIWSQTALPVPRCLRGLPHSLTIDPRWQVFSLNPAGTIRVMGGKLPNMVTDEGVGNSQG